MGQILSNAMKKYVLNATKQGYTREIRSVYDRRIMDYAKKGLKDLTLLAENLPENQVAEVFNKESLGRLIKAVFHLRIRLNLNKEELKARRERILKLCYLALTEIGHLQNAWALAPEVMKVLTKAGLTDIEPLLGIKAIYIQSFSQE